MDFASQHLKPEGALVVKLFHGGAYAPLVQLFKDTFRLVKPVKPIVLVAKLRSLQGLFSSEALSLPYYRDAGLHRWVESVQGLDAAIVFYSVMADYVPDLRRMPTLVDFVDMDSAKWTQYSGTHRWPLSWLYRREGERLFDRVGKPAEDAGVQAAGEGLVGLEGGNDAGRPEGAR